VETVCLIECVRTRDSGDRVPDRMCENKR
jgi:hypothetical protein